MAFPAGWSTRRMPDRRSLRFYKTGSTTANFEDNAYLFSGNADAIPFVPTPVVRPGSTEVVNLDGPTPYGTGTANAPTTVPMLWCSALSIINASDTYDLEVSFDGTNVHGVVLAGERMTYRDRYEAQVSLRGVGGATVEFHVEAW